MSLHTQSAQRGFALMTSLILIIVMMAVGLSAATKGRLLQVTGKSILRYDEITHIAEAETYRLMNALKQSNHIIFVGDAAVMANGEFKQVWSNDALATVFSSKGLPDFSNFRSSGWGVSKNNGFRQVLTPQTGTIRASYGKVTTEAFVERLIQKKYHSDGKDAISTQYLITVKASSQNPGDVGKKRETVVVQRVYELVSLNEEKNE